MPRAPRRRGVRRRGRARPARQAPPATSRAPSSARRRWTATSREPEIPRSAPPGPPAAAPAIRSAVTAHPSFRAAAQPPEPRPAPERRRDRAARPAPQARRAQARGALGTSGALRRSRALRAEGVVRHDRRLSRQRIGVRRQTHRRFDAVDAARFVAPKLLSWPLRLTQPFRDATVKNLTQSYARLGIHFDDFSGESQVSAESIAEVVQFSKKVCMKKAMALGRLTFPSTMQKASRLQLSGSETGLLPISYQISLRSWTEQDALL